MRPALTFDMTRIRIFVTQVRIKHRAKTKLHDKQVLNKQVLHDMIRYCMISRYL